MLNELHKNWRIVKIPKEGEGTKAFCSQCGVIVTARTEHFLSDCGSFYISEQELFIEATQEEEESQQSDER